MNWHKYQKQSPRTLPSVLEIYKIDELFDPSINIPSHLKTAMRQLCFRADLGHMALGMCSELEELEEAILNNNKVNIGEELTDILWYCSGAIYIYHKRFNIDLTYSSKLIFNFKEGLIFDKNHLLKKLYSNISIFSDIPKKTLAYKKNYESQIIDGLLLGIIMTTSKLMKSYDLNIERCLQNNIDKLRVRYPDSFNIESANNRNLDAESKELEK